MVAITNATQRSTTTPKLSPSADQTAQIRKKRSPATTTIAFNVTLTWPFTIPSTSEAAIVRILGNLSRFKLLYVVFIWAVLSIALLPARKESLLLLSVTANFTFLYVLMLRAMPGSVLLHKFIDKRLVATLVAVATTVEMIATDAGVHLVIVLASTFPVILLHALLVAADGEDFVCGVEGSEEDDQMLLPRTMEDADEKAMDSV